MGGCKRPADASFVVLPPAAQVQKRARGDLSPETLPGCENVASVPAATQVRVGIERATEEHFAQRYALGGQVGESGDVRFATRLSDNLPVVVKVRSKATFTEAGHRRWRAATERQMRMPKCSTMCDVMEVFETYADYYIVMEKVHGADLFETAMQASLAPEHVREIVRQVLGSLASMHGAGCIHKDLKLDNVMARMSPLDMSACNLAGNNATNAAVGLTSNTCSAAVSTKLIDFDTLEDWEPNSPLASVVVGTDGYIAPEAYKGEYSPASDVFSVGVMMYALLTHRFPFRDSMFDDGPGENYVGSAAMERIYRRLQEHKISFARFPCEHSAALCRSLLAFSAVDRPSAKDALSHAWFGNSHKIGVC